MDLRKEKNSQFRSKMEPSSTFRDVSRNQSPYGAMVRTTKPNATGPEVGYSRSGETSHFNYGNTQRISSPGQEESLILEQRHEELKRQIALKEKQLADMTGERNTVNALRHKLGLDNDGSSASIFREERNPRIDVSKGETKRGYLSVSPVNTSDRPGMTGMKSSHLRNTSEDPTVGVMHNINDRKNQMAAQYEQQQLQFHPTRLNRRPAGGVNRTSNSPLRSKSRSKSRGSKKKQMEETYNNFNNLDQSRQTYAPLSNDRGFLNRTETSRQYEKSSNSPLRTRSPIGNEIGSSSSNNLIRPQPIRSYEDPPNYDLNETRQHHQTYSFNANPVNLSSLPGQDARNQLYRDRIEAMTLDNQSLQRRLNQVSTELERIQRENEDIKRNIGLSDGDVANLQDLISNKDNVDAQNQIMQDDLERIRLLNNDLDAKIKDEEMDTANTNSKLNQANAQKKNIILESDNINHDLKSKLRQYDEISREKGMVVQKLNNVSNELERLNREELQLNHENIDMETHMSRLQTERRELLANIEGLTINLDDCVRDLTRDKRDMDGNNDWHVKLIMSKIIFQRIEQCISTRRQEVFREMHEYSEFDRNCHTKLRNFANVALKLGQYKQRMGLNQWYDKALKPLRTRHQNDDISIVIDCNKLQAKVFYAWRQYQRDKMDMYNFKTNSIEKIWHLLAKDARQEQKRAMDIWKQRQGFQKHQLKTMFNLLKKRKDSILEQALFNWKSSSQMMGHSCRLRLLQIDYSQKLFTSHVFYQMRMILKNEKRKRQRTLNHFVKAWKDYIIYNRHLMQTNMAAIQFGQVNQTYLKRNVFDELRQNAEQRKHQLLSHAVEEDMNVAISETQQFNQTKSLSIKTHNQMRAGNIVRDMFGKKLFAYFIHWHNQKQHYKTTMDTKVRDRIIKLYNKLIGSYFDHWKKNMNTKQRKKKMKMVEEMQMQADTMQNDAIQQEKTLRVQAEAVRTSKRKIVDKSFRKLFFRKLAVALGRWKDICIQKNTQEDKASLVIKRMRNRFLRQAFDRYLEFLRKNQQHSRNEKSADYIVETFQMRQMRKVFNSYCQYTASQKEIKRYWNKILTKMDLFLKKRAVNRWNERAHIKFTFDLESQQNQLIAEIKHKNEQISKYTVNQSDQSADIVDINTVQQKNAYRQIANFFMRSYTNQTSEKFITWKTLIQSQNHKRRLLKRSLEHYRRVQLESVRRAFRKFLSDERRKENLDKIKDVNLESRDIQILIDNANKKQEKYRKEHGIFTSDTGCVNEEHERKIIHVMECMERKNLNWVHVSRKRMIFEMWRHVGKMEKAFCFSVKNVLEKSLLKEGFDQITGTNRDLAYTEKVHRALKRFSVKSAKTNCSDSFNKWKMAALSKVENRKEDANQLLMVQVNEFEAFVDQAKDINNARVYKFFLENNKSNIWKAWNNVIQNLKLVKSKTTEFKTRQLKIQKVDAIRTWKSRIERTKRCRAKNNNLIRQFNFKYYKAAFIGWKTEYKNKKRFLNSLSNLEMLMRNKIQNDSFKAVQSFSVSKGLVIGQRKHKGSEDLLSLVRQAYLKNLGAEFQKYKNQTGVKNEKSSKLKVVYGKFHTSRLRDAFNWWRKIDEKTALAQELYDTGPVRAEHWQAEREIANLKEFMREQHYTEDEIDKFFGDVCKTNNDLMKKYLTRMLVFQDDKKKNLPIIWQRWKEFVALRKLLKYQFNFCHNQTDNIKADIQRAFNIWKRGPNQLEEELWKLPIDTLLNLGMKTTKELEEAGDQIAENQSITNHLILQRDEFLNYYIKGQILAMALVRDRVKFAEMQSLSRWLWARRLMMRRDKEHEIRDAAYLHANLQKREKELQEENKQLEGENADLGQFTADGQIIKQNMERLQAERDKIAGQIGETDDDYKELLDRNQQLLRDVEEAEKKVKEQAGAGRRFQNLPAFKNFNAEQSIEEEKETSAEREQKKRFNRLAQLSQGAGLR